MKKSHQVSSCLRWLLSMGPQTALSWDSSILEGLFGFLSLTGKKLLRREKKNSILLTNNINSAIWK